MCVVCIYMAGLGIEYPPPTETLPIFDATVFLLAKAEDLGGLVPIIPSPAGSYVLSSITVNDYGQVIQASSGQGIPPLNPSPAGVWEISEDSSITVTQFGQVTAITGGALTPDPTGTFTNATVQVNKFGQVLTASSGPAPIPATQTITAGTTQFNENGSVTYNKYGQITAATSGYISPLANYNMTQDGKFTVNEYGQVISVTNGGLTPSPAGMYTCPTITVNAYGQVTDAFSVTPSNVISVQKFTSSSTITFPAGTQYATIMLSGAGGASGSYYYDPTPGNQSTQAGGAGGGGGFVYMNRLPAKVGTFMNVAFNVDLQGDVLLNYLPIPNTPYFQITTKVAQAHPGTNGANAVPNQGGNPSGGTGGSTSVFQQNFGLAYTGTFGGAGQTIGAGSLTTLKGVNLLGNFAAANQIAPDIDPLCYGVGGYTRINNPLNGDTVVSAPGSSVCIVISYSS